MKRIYVLSLGVLMTLAAMAPAAETSGLEPLQGKWSVTRTNRQGETYVQLLQFQQNKMTLEVQNPGGDTRFYAKGNAKAENAGPFKAIKVTDIQAGRSANELEDVPEPRAFIYTFHADRLVIASNFDRESERDRPTLDAYTRVGGVTDAAAVGKPAEALAGLWKLQLKYGEETRDYEIRLARSGDGWTGVLISPRSGEHKMKKVEFKDPELRMEVDREYSGNTVTIVYTGKLTNGKLAGKFAVQGRDDYQGTWEASK